MAYELDPEIAPVLAAVLEQSAGLPVVARGDWKTLRERGNSGQAYLASRMIMTITGLETCVHGTGRGRGTEIVMRGTRQEFPTGFLIEREKRA